MKKIMFAISILIIVAVLAGCAPVATQAPAATEAPAAPAATEAPAAPAATEAPASPSIAPEVNVAIGFDPGQLSPFTGMSMGRISVLKTIFEYLVEVDEMGNPSVPMLAKSVEQTGEKTYVVTLFDYITDSAGNHITAADVAWSYNTAMELGNLRPLGSIESVTATGDYTVEFVFKEELGLGDLDKMLTECPILSQKAYEASPDQMATQPVTTSAYVLTEYIPGSSLTFERRPDYWQTDPQYRTLFSQANVEKIVYQIITEPAQHAIALETGSVDISGSVTGDDITRFQDNPDFTVFQFLDNITQLIAFNGTEGNPFTKPELRQAVAYALDTPAMCQVVSPDACLPAHTLGNTNFYGYPDKWNTEPYYDYDLAKAKELLAAAGYKPGDLTVKLLGQTDPKSTLITQVIQASLKDIGINVTIDQVEPAVFNQMQFDPTAFDMVISGTAAGDFAVSPWLYTYDQNRNNGTTSSFFKDDEMQAMLMNVATIDGFTPENLDAFNNYQKEKLYAYGLFSYMNNIASDNGITQLVLDTRGQMVPGAFTYSDDFGSK